MPRLVGDVSAHCVSQGLVQRLRRGQDIAELDFLACPPEDRRLVIAEPHAKAECLVADPAVWISLRPLQLAITRDVVADMLEHVPHVPRLGQDVLERSDCINQPRVFRQASCQPARLMEPANRQQQKVNVNLPSKTGAAKESVVLLRSSGDPPSLHGNRPHRIIGSAVGHLKLMSLLL